MLERLQDKIRELGWADASWFIADTLLRRLSFGLVRVVKYYFVAQPVVPPKTQVSRRGAVRMYATDAIDDIIRQAPRPEENLQSRVAQRARCVVAEREGVLAGFIWLCPDRYREDTLRCEYRWVPVPPAVWDFDVFIAPSHRMGLLFARLWERAHALLAEQSVRWTLSRIDAFNPGSLSAHRKLGARDLARGWFLIVGRMQITACTLAPYFHLSLSADNGPVLCFDLARLEHQAAAAAVIESTATACPPGERDASRPSETVGSTPR